MLKRILRILVALFFIASGFVKAVDPVGFSFKLEEYFSPQVFNIPFLEKFALPLAVMVIAFEMVLGFMLLFKVRVKLTLKLMIALCIFFAFLTFYSAYYNVVTDCGCFGDAIKFKPWESFWKDIILLIALIILWMINRNSNKEDKSFGCITGGAFAVYAVIIIIFMYYGVKHEPLIDFRSYKIGVDMNVERQKISQNPSEYKTFYILKNTKTGENKEVNQDDYIKENYWQDPNWKIEDGKTTSKVVKQGYESSIDKFKLEDINGVEITEEVLKAPRVVLLFSYDPKKMDAKEKVMVEALTKQMENKALVYGVSTEPNIFPTLKNALMDGVAIKTIARSNPFILILEKGKIVAKKSAKDYFDIKD